MATTARTRQDVDNMSTEDQIWDSLSNKYGLKKDEITESYNQAFSQLNNQMLSRGMQRSSYGNQLLGNMMEKRNKAYAANTSELIAAYEDRLLQEKDKAWQRDYQERSLAQNQAQFEASQAQNQSQFEANLGLQKEQFAEQKAQNAWSNNFQQQQADREQANADRNYNFQQQQADLAQQNTEWEQRYKQTQADRDQANADRAYDYQVGRDAVSDAQWREQFDTQNSQWQQQFDFSKMSADQQIAVAYVQDAIQKGSAISDDLLARAGLSRADYEAMKAQVAAGGGGGGGKPKTDKDDDKKGLNLGDLDADAINIWEGLNDKTETLERGKKLAQKINKG